MAARVIGGRYELLHEIGRGGMGTVYAGRDARSGRACAIKVIREEAALSSDARDRFEREARAPGRIGHPGLVEVYDAFAEEDGRMVLVMELLEGVSLREVLGSDAGFDAKLAVLYGALDPLAAAHAAGFVHRDMKPDNVFVADLPGGERRVKILDFGIARDLGSGALTETGVIVGSVRYISPEQAHSARKVEPPADVFSIGVMLYEAATGALPFGSESALKTLTNLAAGNYVPLDERVSGLPRALVDLVHECLAFDPSARPAHAGVLRDRLAPLAPPTLDALGDRATRDDAEPGWASEVRPVVQTPPVPTPMEGARSGRRAKGTSFVQMIKTVKVALRGGLQLPITDADRAWLDQRVIVSDWYPFERFEWLIALVHAHLMGGTDGAGVKMGRMAAEHLLQGVHSGFVKPGNVQRSLQSLPNAWTRYFDFATVTVTSTGAEQVTVRVTDYEHMSRVHELMLLGWALELVSLAGGEVTEHEVVESPTRGDADLVVWLSFSE
ncbi:MAG: serine/threonine protein kinase [Sandaracinaceae bacterium]|nr:serine/threonine protein kinase [Sandaracinaceae bacterium]